MATSKKRSGARESGGIVISGRVRDMPGNFAGRDLNAKTKIITKTKSITRAQQVKEALGDMTQAVAAAPPEVKQEAGDKLKNLKKEIAKGDKSDDGVLSRLVKGLVDLVPGATKALVSAFGTPLLGEIAGPLTKEAIEKLGHLGGEHRPKDPMDKSQAI